MVCIRCQKRPAIIFIQRMDNGQMKQEGYCLHCARELHIKPVDDLMKQFGMSDQDLDNMENRMESMMEEMGDANPLSMMMNMANGGEDADPDSMDEDLIPGSTALFGSWCRYLSPCICKASSFINHSHRAANSRFARNKKRRL